MIDSPIFKDIDWGLIALVVVCSALGVVSIYSASHYLPGNLYLKQAFWIFISSLFFIVIISIDYKIIVAYSFYLYFICLALLIGLQLFGRLTAGTTRWIKMFFFQIQPSELTKIVVILVLARIFSEFKGRYLSSDKVIKAGAVVLLPFLLVAIQPDMGTALTFIAILFAAFILTGLNKKVVVILTILTLLGAVVTWNFFLKEYQKKRIITLIAPAQDPLGAGYQILQSKIAIGSGGFLGKGYKKGTQSQLRFLPARHTDFIFSVIGEEFGFVGVGAIFFLYFLLLSRLFNSVRKSRDRAGMYITFMVSVLIAFQFFVNVMVVIGLFPVTGIPLPFLSYGGSSLITNYLAAGLVLNVTMRRFVNV
ncbi:MAG: rod shape-determining protein RodA [Candidatus Aminicenantales bacterium]